MPPHLTNDDSSPKFDRKQEIKPSKDGTEKKLSYPDVSPKEQMLMHANLKVTSVKLPCEKLHV